MMPRRLGLVTALRSSIGLRLVTEGLSAESQEAHEVVFVFGSVCTMQANATCLICCTVQQQGKELLSIRHD